MTQNNKVLAWAIALTIGLSAALLASRVTAEEKNNDPSKLPLEDVQRFSIAISQIKNYYVKPVNDKSLFEDAIRGMLEGLDPHSSYLSEEDFKELRESTSGEFGGLGIEVTMEKGLIKVVSPIDDTPAAKAGIKPGDYIVRIEDKPVKDLTLREAVSMMRGKPGSELTITIFRKGETKPLHIKLARAIIHIQSVKSRLLDKVYGYVRISHFQSPTADDVIKAVENLKKDTKGELKGLIIDLRNNPGGLLDSAVKISDTFIDNDKKGKEEIIVYTKGRLEGSQMTAAATPGDILDNKPIIVLINEGSASGSEILAGALQDNKRAIIVGKKSFGKGSVQTILPLSKDTGVKLTTALYYTPSGRSIQAKGIDPDIIIEDIKFPKADADKLDLENLSEADLKGHLANGNEPDGSDKAEPKSGQAVDKEIETLEVKEKASKEDLSLMASDYQLFEALNLLKGLTLVRK